MVVTAGETVVLPDAATLPTPLSMVTEVAPEVDHVNVVDCPAVMVVGDAESVAVGSEVPVTVTVTESVALPAEFVAVMV